MKISNAFIFTAISLLTLLAQHLMMRHNISKIKEENQKLRIYIQAGHRKHLAALRAKDKEKEAMVASYSYSINKEEIKINKDYEEGYKEGYHRAIEDSYCPVEHFNKF